jgi:hypothetical protein
MTTMNTCAHLSLHDRRVRLISNAARAHFDLTEKDAFEFATRAALALNHIPEKRPYGDRLKQKPRRR